MALKTFTTADGSANQALVTNGSGVLSFAAVGASAGQVIQVLSATDSTRRTTTSNSFATNSNTLSVTITPSSASNKIFIIVNTAAYIADTGTNVLIGTIYRGATNLGASSSSGGLGVGGRGENTVYNGGGSLAMSYLDSPNTTSAITYQVYFKNRTTSTTSILNDAADNANSVTGSITCMEIKG